VSSTKEQAVTRTVGIIGAIVTAAGVLLSAGLAMFFGDYDEFRFDSTGRHVLRHRMRF
jgi:hypothetical protein